MSKLKEIKKKHREEIEDLQDNCSHDSKFISVSEDGSCVGAGSRYPSIHVVCTNCGRKKIIFRRSKEEADQVIVKSLDPQGFKDERLNLSVQYDRELEKKG